MTRSYVSSFSVVLAVVVVDSGVAVMVGQLPQEVGS